METVTTVSKKELSKLECPEVFRYSAGIIYHNSLLGLQFNDGISGDKFVACGIDNKPSSETLTKLSEHATATSLEWGEFIGHDYLTVKWYDYLKIGVIYNALLEAGISFGVKYTVSFDPKDNKMWSPEIMERKYVQEMKDSYHEWHYFTSAHTDTLEDIWNYITPEGKEFCEWFRRHAHLPPQNPSTDPMNYKLWLKFRPLEDILHDLECGIPFTDIEKAPDKITWGPPRESFPESQSQKIYNSPCVVCGKIKLCPENYLVPCQHVVCNECIPMLPHPDDNDLLCSRCQFVIGKKPIIVKNVKRCNICNFNMRGPCEHGVCGNCVDRIAHLKHQTDLFCPKCNYKIVKCYIANDVAPQPLIPPQLLVPPPGHTILCTRYISAKIDCPHCKTLQPKWQRQTIQNNGESICENTYCAWCLSVFREDVYSLELSKAVLSPAARKTLLESVIQNDQCLKHASDTIKDDREFVLAAVKRNGYVLAHASERLRNDRELVMIAVQQRGSVLGYVGEKFQADREIVLAAVKQHGDALEYASEEFHNDREIVMAAISQEGQALKYVSKELRDDYDVVLTAVKQNGYALGHCSKAYRENQYIVVTAINQCGGALQYASDQFRAEPTIVVLALARDGNALRYASETLRNVRDLVMLAVTQNGYALEHASAALRNDREIVLTALEHVPKREYFCCSHMLYFVGESLCSDREIVLRSMAQHGYNLEFAAKTLHNDREIVLAAVNQNGNALQFASKDLRNDYDIATAAIKATPNAIEYVGDSIRSKLCQLYGLARYHLHGHQNCLPGPTNQPTN